MYHHRFDVESDVLLLFLSVRSCFHSPRLYMVCVEGASLSLPPLFILHLTPHSRNIPIVLMYAKHMQTNEQYQDVFLAYN